ncbi:uncharacterized protein LOC116349927 isoform X2 [Contarinia nasturtii]|uniref:uncharacterized protein LOC116349927 isoform X2 n=1 Tax=Contarinia nasturtii TaxID=265458 RepID=UPI0012D3AE3E|nr:uncharacterized protein LOC116349927 isoform X2 [Contarinia nasturtii]
MSESKLPIIIVCSEGAKKGSQEIIDNLRKESSDKNTIDLGNNVLGYKFHNCTKYYENDLVFLSHESNHINLVPVELLDRIEGVIVYFDSDNKDFLHKLPVYANFIERNNIEFGILLCSELYDNSLDGITYKESKEFSNVLDVIELERKRDTDDDDQCAADSHHDPLGYDEVLQTIRAIIWSNVDMKRKLPQSKIPHDESEEEDKMVSVDTLEAELSGFEQLLTEVMAFKETTATWSRNERLAYAEKFADAFDNLLQNKVLDADTSSSDSDSPPNEN